MAYHRDLAVRMSRAVSRICSGEADGGHRLCSSIVDCAASIDTPRQGFIVGRVELLASAGARLDAALALLAMAPEWRLRRLVFDEGRWHCSLSRQSGLPDWLDDTVDAHAADSAVAVVTALADLAGSCAVEHGEDTRPIDDGAERVSCDHFV
jgi:hypothetical protein